MSGVNQSLASKIGEIMAFSQNGEAVFKKGGQALKKVFDPVFLEEIIQSNNLFASSIQDIASKMGIWEIVAKKAESTGNKLESMQGLYLEDEWDDPVEILEWLGFFEGAALVHWSLVNGKAKQASLKELVSLSEKAISFHQNLLRKIVDTIQISPDLKSTA